MTHDTVNRLATAVALVLTSLAAPAWAQVIAQHQGLLNPTTEGFGVGSSGTPSTVGPVTNDLGLNAWSIAGPAPNSVGFYNSGALTAQQQAAVASFGFTLTVTDRMVTGPVFSPNSVASPFAELEIGTKRYDIDLGLTAAGDTVVVLPDSITQNGNGTFSSVGSSVTIPGNGYHTYQLVFNPTTQLADLFVDGVDRIQNYAGHTSFALNRGLVFGDVSGGTGNFNLVQLLVPVPEPTGLALLGPVVAGALGAAAIRKKRFGRAANHFT
jgi:hypothetical protein